MNDKIPSDEQTGAKKNCAKNRKIAGKKIKNCSKLEFIKKYYRNV